MSLLTIILPFLEMIYNLTYLFRNFKGLFDNQRNYDLQIVIAIGKIIMRKSSIDVLQIYCEICCYDVLSTVFFLNTRFFTGKFVKLYSPSTF